MKIYTGSLSFNVKENELRAAFEKYGLVADVKIITDEHSGRSKGFGFVTMNDPAEANKAIKGLNGSELADRKIKVNEAQSRART